jgi:CheY-like chemotaxis protein
MEITHTILLIDDDPDDRELFEEVLREGHIHHRIIQAENGVDGIEKLHELLKTKELPCLIVLDVNMPKLDGKQTFILIKEDIRLFKIPVVILTTSASETDREFFRRENVHYITKPLDFEHLTKVAGRLLNYCEDRFNEH